MDIHINTFLSEYQTPPIQLYTVNVCVTTTSGNIKNYLILSNKYRCFAYVIQMASQNSYWPPGLI